MKRPMHTQTKVRIKLADKMKRSIRQLTGAGISLCALLAGSTALQAQTTLAVDSTKSWIGYMNVFNLPSAGGGYVFGQGWGTADLRAFFNGTNSLTLTPNTNVFNPTDAFWANPDGSGNKTMDASFYVQDDTLAGQTLAFSGTCLSNSLVSPYTSVAFIKDFAPDYSFNIPVTANLVAGQPFSINLSTTAGHHIQYGFETIGPDVSPTNLASQGLVVIAVNNADPTLSSVAGQALVEGQTAHFTVTAKGTAPFTYQWVLGNAIANTNLVNGGRISGATTSTLTISNVVAGDAATYSVVVSNALGSSALASANLSVVPLAQAKTNMLIDPSFESAMFSPTSDAGWVNFNGTAQANTNNFYYLSATPVSVLDGTNCIQTYSTGPGSYNGIYQDRPAVPGQVYIGSVWLRTPSVDQLGGAGQAWVEAQFHNAGGGLIGYYKSAMMDTNSPADVWIRAQPTNHLATDFVTFLGSAPYMVAPPGTTSVRFQVNYRADTGGSVYVDLADLTLKSPVPTASISGSNMQISFPTLYGPTYQVFYRTSLNSGSWQLLTSVSGDGTVKIVTDSIGAGPRFYVVNTQ